MLVFSHLGIGSKLVSPWSKSLKKTWIFVGTLLPDLIDKPLYYSLSLATGKAGTEIGLVSGTRTFGHTGLFLLMLIALGLARRSRLIAALSLGTASHLLLDHLMNCYLSDDLSGALNPLLWPWVDQQFPAYPFTSVSGHVGAIAHPVILAGEIIGLLILIYDFFVSYRAKPLE